MKHKFPHYFSRDKKTGEIILRIVSSGSSYRFKTNIYCNKEDFSKGFVNPTSIDAIDAKHRLLDLRNRINSSLNPMKEYSRDLIDRIVFKGYKHREIDYTLMNAINYGLESSSKYHSIQTNKSKENAINSFNEFLRLEYNADDIIGDQINLSIGTKYKDYLITRGLSPTGILSYFSMLHSLFNIYLVDHCDVMESVVRNPFSLIRHKMKYLLKDIPKKRRQNIVDNTLSKEDIKAIEEYEFIGKNRFWNNWYRLTILWQIYTGFSFIDLCMYNWKILENKNGKYVELYREKTNERCVIPLFIDSESIYNKLVSLKKKTLFPFGRVKNNDEYVASYQRYRYFLKKFSDILGIELRSHLFRHTFGMMMSEKEIPIEKIAAMMGHSSSKTTEMYYVRPKDESIVESAKNLSFML